MNCRIHLFPWISFVFFCFFKITISLYSFYEVPLKTSTYSFWKWWVCYRLIVFEWSTVKTLKRIDRIIISNSQIIYIESLGTCRSLERIGTFCISTLQTNFKNKKIYLIDSNWKIVESGSFYHPIIFTTDRARITRNVGRSIYTHKKS